MTGDWRELITWIISTTLALAALAGLMVRWVLLPYLREHLLKPMQRVEHQVSVNAHQSDEPTVLDRLDDMHTEVRELRAEQRRTRSDLSDLSRQVGDHLLRSESWSAEVESRLGGLHWPSLGRQRKPGS